MMPLNRNLDDLRLSGIRRFTSLAKKVGNCTMLTLGEPEFPTPRPIQAACVQALVDAHTHYTENRGYAALREAISQFEREKRGLTYSADEIIVTAGATQAIYLAMVSCLNPGDEVIIPTPAFGLYHTVAQICGAVPVAVDTTAADFQLTGALLERAITPRTKLLILNSPNNPTGVVYSADTLWEIARLAEHYGFYILSDDVYWGLGPCPTFSQFSELKKQIFSVQSFSKPYAMTGWRIGYLMVPEELAGKLTALHGHMITCAPAMVQQAAITALSIDPGPMAESYGEKRELVMERLEYMKLPCVRPEGAFYAFPSIAHLGMNAETFCMRLIRDGQVATVPGSVFGCEGHFRLSYCCSMEELREGLNRMERFLQSIAP